MNSNFMNRMFFLYFGMLLMAQACIFCPEAKVETENRSLMNAFTLSEKKNEKSNAPALPVAPKIDTKELDEKNSLPSSPASTKIATAQKMPAPIPVKKSTEQIALDAESLKEEQEKDQLVRFYFEDASLENLVRYIEELFSIKFFSDDDLNPAPPQAGLLKGNKITFKTNKSLTREQAWNLFLKFLDMAGLSAVETQMQGFYRITTITNANKEVLPTFFNTSTEVLPDSSLKIRYVFFIKNSPMQTIQTVTSQLASPSAVVNTFPDFNAIMVTDKSVNIRSLMKIIQEFDKEMPEAMSVVKLKKVDAQDVAQLYSDLTKTENPLGAARYMNQKAQPDSLYFPANVRIIIEPRTNALILLGPAKSLEKIEKFIVENIDVDVTMPYSPLYIYEVQYLNAANLVTILNQAISFGQGTTAAAFGGVRNQNEYFGPITITPEPTGNRIVIKAAERDYKKLLMIIKELDVIQPEVAIEILIVNVTSTNSKALGAQIHNKAANYPIQNVNYQTSGLPVSGGGISGPQVSNTGSLLGNLISLATNGTANGSSYLTIGSSGAGVWAIFRALQAYSEASIVANPFLTTTNNYSATASVGSSRQIQTGSVISAQGPTASYDTYPANLMVQVTPQISLDGSVQMSVNINLTDFSDSTNLANGNTFTKAIVTSVSVKDKEIVVLGGLVKNTESDIETKVPILGDIPLIGWIFKNKQSTTVKSNILIFISPRILTPQTENSFMYYTLNKAEEAKETCVEIERSVSSSRDPIDRSFFAGTNLDEINEFLMSDSRMTKAEDIIKKSDKVLLKKGKRKRKKETPKERTYENIENVKESVDKKREEAKEKKVKTNARQRFSAFKKNQNAVSNKDVV